MNGLVEGISNISLDQNPGKKHKRPFRAFHTFDQSQSQSTNANTYPAAPPGHSSLVNNASFNKSHMIGMVKNAGQVYNAAEQSSTGTTSHIVPTQRLEDQQQMLARTFLPDVESVPPLFSTQFYSANQGTCDPRLMSLSLYNIPENEQLRSATKLPIGLNVHPFATVVPTDVEITAIDTRGVGGPIRCRRCRSYANPKYKFTFDSKFVCNFCQINTPVPYQYLPQLSQTGDRPDLLQHLGLVNGVVEFTVPDLYKIKQDSDLVPLHYVFLIDISIWANENKSSLVAIESVRTAINYIRENQPNCKVAIIAFDRWLRFFNLRPESTQAQELVVSELKDIFLPLHNGLFVRPEESMHVIQDTLLKLESFIQDDKFMHKNEACFGSAIEAAVLALKTITNGNGGKIIATLNTIPTIGNGNLIISRDDGLKPHIKCENEFYTNLARDMLNSYISLDLFCTGAGYMDLATLAYPVFITSGNMKHYPDFNVERSEFKFVNDIVHSVSSTVGYQAQLKVRCSSGLSVNNYYTMACGNSDREPIIPVVTTDQAINVLFKYDDKLKAGTELFFQAALLYTDINGVRKVRSMNSSAAVSNNIHEIIKFLNQDVINSLLIHDVLSKLDNCQFPKIRETIDSKLSDILTQYRALVDSSHGSQLILPDSLKSLPAYLLSFEKSALMRNNKNSSRGNDRIIDYFKLYYYNQHQLVYKLYPQIFPLHEILSDDDFTFYDQNNLLLQFDSVEALSVRNSYNSLVNGGCYMIFQGDTIYIWFNENTNRHLLRDLLVGGEAEEVPYASVTLFGGQLPILETDINVRARNIVRYWSQIVSHSYLPVVLLRPNVDQYYSHTMTYLMCEDKSVEMIESYDTYLLSLHRKIKDNIENERYTKLSNSGKHLHENLAERFIQF
ncbi:Sfb3p Ecym_1323 [Eremothecium cymbalariae DBVPG|uniref:SED5-binding protein 3 n=1 Tax=Eremothecium cymbalariae (strain CBS 270.75 / DBVPG 7215 / KCTC 17166 / NRRL Y-17582) TaxID=931890 RepID=G8JN94_ERECY|nr:hypothetical protein Ecym_1323 [Eremothecium cymbalariae DBVPG\